MDVSLILRHSLFKHSELKHLSMSEDKNKNYVGEYAASEIR